MQIYRGRARHPESDSCYAELYNFPRRGDARHRVIAVVGASKNPAKEAHTVPLYLKEEGYRLIPINPSADEILGEKAYPSLSGLPGSLAKQVEVVEVFRPSEELPEVARQVVEMRKEPSETVRLLVAARTGERGSQGDTERKRRPLCDECVHACGPRFDDCRVIQV